MRATGEDVERNVAMYACMILEVKREHKYLQSCPHSNKLRRFHHDKQSLCIFPKKESFNPVFLKCGLIRNVTVVGAANCTWGCPPPVVQEEVMVLQRVKLTL